MRLCRDEAEINQVASQHYQYHLLVRINNKATEEQDEVTPCIHFHVLLLQRAGLQGFSLTATQNKRQRMNNNVALQHYHQTVMDEHPEIT